MLGKNITVSIFGESQYICPHKVHSLKLPGLHFYYSVKKMVLKMIKTSLSAYLFIDFVMVNDPLSLDKTKHTVQIILKW